MKRGNILHEAAALATTAGANFSAIVEHADNPAGQITASADELDVDVVVVSGRSRTNAGRLSLGQTIPAILRSIDCTVIAVLVPERSVPAPSDTFGAEGCRPTTPSAPMPSAPTPSLFRNGESCESIDNHIRRPAAFAGRAIADGFEDGVPPPEPNPCTGKAVSRRVR